MIKFGWASLLSLAMLGCGNPEYVSSTPVAPKPIPASPVGEGTSPVKNDGDVKSKNGQSQTNTTTPENVAENPCLKERKILVVDLKSGWFAGDGGDFFNRVTTDVCGGLVKIHYVHFTIGTVDSNINPAEVANCSGSFCTSFKDIRSYDQFWILSGDEADSADVRLSSPLFQSIVSRAVELRDANPKAGFYFGAGLGNIHHANALGKALFPQLAGSNTNRDSGIFTANPNGRRGVLPVPTLPMYLGENALLVGSGLAAGSFDATSRPFKAFGPYASPMASLFDYRSALQNPSPGIAGSDYLAFDCLTDPVAPAGGGLNESAFKVVATDHCGKSAVAIANPGGHLVMADGNTARHYGYANDPAAYFHRAILSMLQ
ncbi:MAG: hypothetical protein ACO3A4_03980 [Silvanigrellaceae bacterium]